MLSGYRTYKEFLGSYERIATNILADRLRSLERHGIIHSTIDPGDRRKLIYRLTRKGIDLAPVLTELVLWAGSHEKTENQSLLRLMQENKAKFLLDIRDRWEKSLAT